MKQQYPFFLADTRRKFHKAQLRLEKALATGTFFKMSSAKKQEIVNRLKRYARQLGAALKPGLATAMIAAGLLIGHAVNAQTFIERTGALNPLNGKSVTGTASKPAFVDLDNDGDKDLVAGQYDIDYYVPCSKFVNTGTAPSPTFGSRVDFTFGNLYAAPAFVDIDNDGDQDLFIGNINGTIDYYKNTGTAAAPAFTVQGGVLNPFNLADVGDNSRPSFVDIDNDGDKDVFIGNTNGQVAYYKNTGTATLPVFAAQAGLLNPFNGVFVTSMATISFADIDTDGDKDAILGSSTGALIYFKNTGTAAAPVFALQSGAANPFNGVDVGALSAPAFVDIDNDGDQDLFSGRADGGFSFFENTTSTLPLEWQNFTAQRQSNSEVLLNWSTLTEQNCSDFLVQHSMDGRSWKNIGIVTATGNSSTAQYYRFLHPAAETGTNYYRLQQRDLDARSSYSDVKTVRITNRETSFTLLANPVTNGNLQIQVNSSLVLRLYNNNGQLLLQQQFAAGTHILNISRYPKGVYYLKGKEQAEQLLIQ